MKVIYGTPLIVHVSSTCPRVSLFLILMLSQAMSQVRRIPVPSASVGSAPHATKALSKTAPLQNENAVNFSPVKKTGVLRGVGDYLWPHARTEAPCKPGEAQRRGGLQA